MKDKPPILSVTEGALADFDWQADGHGFTPIPGVDITAELQKSMDEDPVVRRSFARLILAVTRASEASQGPAETDA